MTPHGPAIYTDRMEAYVHDAVQDMHMARDELLAAIARIGPDDWDRVVPYGSRTLKELLAHLAAADQVWAAAARGLLKSEADERAALTPAEAAAARDRAIARGRDQSPGRLLDEMASRRRLLLSLYDLLEPRHLALSLPTFGDTHNSVRERIWRGYHDRVHAADILRALRMNWHPPRLSFLDDLLPVVEALSPAPTLYVIFSVDPVMWEAPSPDPGWSYRDLLAHIATGDWVLQQRLRGLIDDGRVPDAIDVDAGNAQRVQERRVSTPAALVEEFLSMRHETMLLLAQLKPKHLRVTFEFPWEPRPNQHTVLEFLRGFWRHDNFHREQLRSAMRYQTAEGKRRATVQT